MNENLFRVLFHDHIFNPDLIGGKVRRHLNSFVLRSIPNPFINTREVVNFVNIWNTSSSTSKLIKEFVKQIFRDFNIFSFTPYMNES